MPLSTPRLLSVTAYAKAERISPDHVRYMAYIGDIDALHLGRRMLIKPQSFDWDSVPTIMTIPEASRILGISVMGAYRLRLPHYYEPGSHQCRYVLKIDLQAYIEDKIETEA